jgi:hypothetical protein
MLATVANPYEIGFDKNAANYVPLTPISFLLRSAAIEMMRAEQARLKARQGVAYPVLDDLMVAGGVNPAASERAQKSREGQRTSRLCKGPGC